MIQRLIYFSFFIFIGIFAAAQNDKNLVELPSHEAQIKTALYAAPESQKQEAGIIGYDANGRTIMLREGKNDIICLTDNPFEEGISAACYHKKLARFMERGRELRAQGVETAKLREIRGEEIRSGKIEMPENGVLYVFTAKDEDYDLSTGEVKNGHLRYVFYVPYATTESTGLADKPSIPGMPWLMDAGTHRAHIMITPPRE